MSARRHEQPNRTFGSDRRVLDVWFPFDGAGSIETDGEGVLVVVEGDAAIAGFFGDLQNQVLAKHREGFWLCSGRLEVVVLSIVLSLTAQFAYWSRIVSGLNQESN